MAKKNVGGKEKMFAWISQNVHGVCFEYFLVPQILMFSSLVLQLDIKGIIH